MTVQDDNLLRNIQSYTEDVLINNVSETGVKENCIWHQLSGFYVTTNYTVDIMHDLFEGVCNFDLTCLLNSLLYRFSLFSLEALYSRIH